MFVNLYSCVLCTLFLINESLLFPKKKKKKKKEKKKKKAISKLVGGGFILAIG